MAARARKPVKPPVKPRSRKKLRLVKVAVQPVFVVDDTRTGEITELEHPAIIVSAADWPTYYERFKREAAAFERDINKQQG